MEWERILHYTLFVEKKQAIVFYPTNMNSDNAI